MPKVVANVNGSYHDKQGVTHDLVAGEVVELPQDLITALGDDVRPATPKDVEGKSKSQEKEQDSKEEDTKVSYKDLQAKANELGIPATGKYDELKAAIEEAEAAQKEKGVNEAPADKQIKDGETITK